MMMKMSRMILVVLLLALHLLSSQVTRAQNATDAPVNATVATPSYNVTPTALLNVTARENNGSWRMEATILLLPLTLLTSLLLTQ